MAYARGLPLLVIVDETVRADGLLEKGYDWFVQSVPLDPASLNSPAFSGVMNSWRERVGNPKPTKSAAPAAEVIEPAKMSLVALAGHMRLSELYGLLAALAAILAASFALGMKFG